MQRIVLASRSTARRKILRDAGLKFSVAFADVDETVRPNESVRKYVSRIAFAKAFAVAKRNKNTIVIGVDTVIAVGNEILGKPKNILEAKRFLRKISGQWHNVYTGIAILNTKTDKTLERVAISKVKFIKLTKQLIDWYVRTGEPMKAAGAYSIQGKGRSLVEKMDGCLTNVIGISIPVVFEMLKKI